MANNNSAITQIQTYMAPLGRLFIATMFVMSGYTKIWHTEGTQAFMESAGVPGFLLPIVIIFEIVAGLAIIAGWWTRTAAFLLSGFCLLTALLFHLDPDNQIQMVLFSKNIAIAGGFLFLVVNGPGAFALDNRGKT